jgi:anti-sigma B factor antagonist
MEITREEREGAVVVKLKGEVDMRSSPELRAALVALTKQKTPTVVVSLAEASYVDSSGIATLIECLKNVHHYQGRFLLVGVNDDIYPVFELAHLTQVFEMRRDTKID